MQYRLRFRVQGRQVVRYIGTDANVAAAVQQALERLQADHRDDRQLRQQAAEARRTLRRLQQALEPSLVAAGYRYHGRAIRRRRPPSGPSRGESVTRLKSSSNAEESSPLNPVVPNRIDTVNQDDIL
jgi:hypothetical protein